MFIILYYKKLFCVYLFNIAPEDKTVEIDVVDKSIAEIIPKDTLSGIERGKTKVTLTCISEGLSESFMLRVRNNTLGSPIPNMIYLRANGETVTIQIDYKDSGLTNVDMLFENYDNTLIDVSKEGNIKPINKGKTKIDVFNQSIGYLEEIKINVLSKDETLTDATDDAIKDGSIDEVAGLPALPANPGDSIDFGVKYPDATIESSNPDIVEVKPDGTLEIKKPGDVTITVTLPGGTVKEEIKVAVTGETYNLEVSPNVAYLNKGETKDVVFKISEKEHKPINIIFEIADNNIITISNASEFSFIDNGNGSYVMEDVTAPEVSYHIKGNTEGTADIKINVCESYKVQHAFDISFKGRICYYN